MFLATHNGFSRSSHFVERRFAAKTCERVFPHISENVTKDELFRYHVSISSLYAVGEHDKTERRRRRRGGNESTARHVQWIIISRYKRSSFLAWRCYITEKRHSHTRHFSAKKNYSPRFAHYQTFN